MICNPGGRVTEQKLHRAVQYVTASTSYGRDIVAEIIHIGFAELAALAISSSRPFSRQTLLEYVCTWTIKQTGQQEQMVREVLGCAARWLDEAYETLSRDRTDFLNASSRDANRFSTAIRVQV